MNCSSDSQIELYERRLAVMKAFKAGKRIQFRRRPTQQMLRLGPLYPWMPCLGPSWDWERFDYCIEPPKPVKVYVLAFKYEREAAVRFSVVHDLEATERLLKSSGAIQLALKEVELDLSPCEK